MEYMMIRSVKSAAAGTSGSDIQKSTLGLISSGSGSSSTHHNNLYQHHLPVSTASFIQGSSGGEASVRASHPQHQYHTVTYPQNNSYDIKLLSQLQPATSADNRCWNLDNRELLSSDAVTPQLSHRKKTPIVLPIFIKSKETLDRISHSRCLQNSTPEFLRATVSGDGGINRNASGCSINSIGVYGAMQQRSTSHLNQRTFSLAQSSLGVTSSLCGSVSNKMSSSLWESSHQKCRTNNSSSLSVSASSSTVTGDGQHSWRKRVLIDTDTSSFSSFTKKQKLQIKTSLHMPNLLKTLSSKGKSWDGKQKSDSSLTLAVVPFKSPSTSLSHVRAGIPIENVFLQKYDPLRLLKRLRCNAFRKTTTAAIVKNLVAPKKKKVVTINNFPTAGSRRTREVIIGRTKRRKRNATEQSNVWTLDGGFNVIRSQSTRKSSATRLPKYCTAKRRVSVKYRSLDGDISYPPLSEDRLRVIAAVHLKRALFRVRNGGKVRSAVLRSRLKRLKTARNRHRNVETNSKDHQINVSAKTIAGLRSGPLAKFHVTKSNLPSPIPIENHRFVMVENPQLMHTLELLRHKRELQDRLEMIESDGSVQKVGPLPVKPEGDGRISFLSESVPLKRRQVKHVISQKLLICLSTVGFTHTKLRPLEVMADATSNFLTKMAQRLKEVSEMETTEVDHGFPDAMERVLIEQGFGGIRGLEEFYRTKVNDFGLRMEEQCLLLRRQYAYKVRSKVGMMSNVNASTTSSISAPSSSSSSVTTTISAPLSSTTSSNISSTATIPPTSIMVVSGGGVNSTAATVAVASKSTLLAKTSSSSSQPLSPGNSVLAEMLASQDDLSVRTPQACSSPSLGMMGSSGPVERQLEDLMGAPPPNVEIRPNSFPHPHHPHQLRQAQLVQQQQQVPLHHLLASLSQQQQSPQSRHQQQSAPKSPQNQQGLNPYVNSLKSPQSQQVLNPYVNSLKSPQNQQGLNPYVNSLYVSSPPLTPPTPPHQLNHKVYQQPSSGHLQSQQSSQLTQLLKRPVSTSATTPHSSGTPPQPPSPHHHLILHHHHPQQAPPPPQLTSQYHHPLHASHLTSPSQLSPVRNANINTTTITANKSSPHPSQVNHHGPTQAVPQGSRHLVQTPHQLNISKAAGHSSSLASGETTYSSNTITQSSTPRTTATSSNGAPSPSNSSLQSGGKLITLIRSSSTGVTPQQGIIVNSNHHHSYQDSSSFLTGGPQDNNVISINLGGHSDIDADPDIGTTPTASTTSSASKAKLKEAISQRNLLRLNFEQVPSGAGDSTVLLSSSSVATSSTHAAGNTNNSVQFLGKVSASAAGGGQGVSWNNTTNNYS